MPEAHAPSARAAALSILLAGDRHRGSADRLQEPLASGLARASVQEFVNGVRRRQWTIDAILRRFVARDFLSTPLKARQAMRLGVFDLLWRPQIPGPKAVSETVALLGKDQKAKGFVNAILRAVVKGHAVCPEPAGPDRHTIWVTGDRFVRFEAPILPDPADDLVQWDSLQYSLPKAFVQRIHTALPAAKEAFFRSTCGHGSLYIRPNFGTSLEALRGELEQFQAVIDEARPDGFLIHLRGAPEDFSALREARARIQDATAAAVVPLLLPQPGERLLDLCAAPGGKSQQIAEALQSAGRLVACDRSARLAPLRQALARFEVAEVSDLGPKGEELPEGPFDGILVDAPCSNSGVLHKRVEARYRLEDEELSGLAVLQDRLLDRAAARIAPGGRIVYSTCSILREENEERSAAFLARHPGFQVEAEFLHWPQDTGRDGGYAVRLRAPKA